MDILTQIRELPCAACHKEKPNSDAHHIKTRKAGGPDAWWNLIPLCRTCHTEWHAYGPSKFFECHPRVRVALKVRGWEFKNLGNSLLKLIHNSHLQEVDAEFHTHSAAQEMTEHANESIQRTQALNRKLKGTLNT